MKPESANLESCLRGYIKTKSVDLPIQEGHDWCAEVRTEVRTDDSIFRNATLATLAVIILSSLCRDHSWSWVDSVDQKLYTMTISYILAVHRPWPPMRWWRTVLTMLVLSWSFVLVLLF